MSLNAILNNAASGLSAAQTSMRATSDNISNVNTPGYARQEVLLAARRVGGIGSGVEVEAVRRVTDRFLFASSLAAKAGAAAGEVTFDILDRAQSAFGDPSTETSLFGSANRVFSTFADAIADPANSVRRTAILDDVETMFAEFDRVASELQVLRAEADARIANSVTRANELIEQIASLNATVQAGVVAGDSGSAENAMGIALDELASLIDIRVVPRTNGAVEVRTTDGVLLAGELAATLDYSSSGAPGAGRIYSPISVSYGDAPVVALDEHLTGGEIKGLLDLRDQELPSLSYELGEYAARMADEINRAHNDSVASPAPQILTGAQTGLLDTDTAVFEGRAEIVMLDNTGAWQERVLLDFDAKTATVDGGASFSFAGAETVADIQAALNAAFLSVDPTASVTFTDGVMTMNGGSYGLSVIQDDAAPSSRAGRGFAQTFGLNDLVRSTKPTIFETGVSGVDASGFATGEEVQLRLVSADGRVLGQSTYTAAAGDTFDTALTQFNQTVGGFGAYGQFDLATGPAADAGALSFTPIAGYEGARIEVVSDTTERGNTGVSFSGLFGVGDAVKANRAIGFAVRDDIVADRSKMALGHIDLTGFTQGDVVTGSGDGAGAQLLQAVASNSARFAAAGDLSGGNYSLLDYAGRVAGDAGRRAAAAERTRDSAAALQVEADARRAAVEGVNMDEELVKLTQFQQAYNASARLMQAVQEMTDTLLQLV